VMVVMPAFPESENSDERVIHGQISCLEHLPSPDVGD
jgi:hypothetical protein